MESLLDRGGEGCGGDKVCCLPRRILQVDVGAAGKDGQFKEAQGRGRSLSVLLIFTTGRTEQVHTYLPDSQSTESTGKPCSLTHPTQHSSQVCPTSTKHRTTNSPHQAAQAASALH
jgi:hypothetical protein